ncbi:MAG: ferritin [Alphaproteobacteria bacterium]|nr:ferritin [Alphaproteobacteria bacterium]
MSSETLHAPRDRLSKETLSLHHAIVSLIEELEAVDWYRQRADDADDEALREILLHNMREEMEHASMVLEWIRRHSSDFAGHLKTYLFTTGSILAVEKEVTGKEVTGAGGGEAASPSSSAGSRGKGFTVGPLKGE